MPYNAQQKLAPRVEVHVSNEVRDPEWDEFVHRTSRASYMQTAAWAEVKASVGWRVHRLIARRAGSIVGGLSLLSRGLPMLGGAGYVSHGPVLAEDDPESLHALLDELEAVVRSERLHYVFVQPPAGYPHCLSQLTNDALRPSVLRDTPSGTVMVDLAQSEEQLLAAMKSKTRYNVRLGARKGIHLREGTSDDLPTFFRILVATAERNAFDTHDQAYFEQVWDTFDAQDRAKLLLAELDGEAISAFLLLTSGDTVTYWRGAWSGRAGALHPNEALHWYAIQWAKRSGYRWYDMDGIELIQMHGVEHGRADTAFKLGFGGEVVLYPRALEIVPNKGLRWASALALGPGATHHTRALIAALRHARFGEQE